ncbi:DEAD/DEAH box helicase [Rathayibacter rathayi]|uniref:Helicase ATP-binding domain-containing protein n=1 Tax=Rathayibacter rathayi TaxID=33887 RepID=A0ABX5AGM1_RATRA|nr:DEAD/DEAH box helicase [Rathayibacter rathayi]PPF23126.1 hypothetical protein C5C34_09870 [Rathayibacter rathayi]PPF51644.1 hypothetical protein C5C08_02230 [Rathayibacter rathayi]PPF83234.1 hypothetical protein C5C14_02265 [Rathayibacter rathayi]PPG14378.1 hypothetical protein C5C11_04900 [Rathayibacter rathayi]PPG47065.1 hypothetical protein C5C20_02225 [Rathayibacter rathayi]
MTLFALTPAAVENPPTGYAELDGTIAYPRLRMTFNGFMRHRTQTRVTMLDWVRGLPGRAFDAKTKSWTVTGLGENPEQILVDAGVQVIYPTGDHPLAIVTSINQLVTPVAMLAPNRRTVWVRHRFLGFDLTRERVGVAATYDKKSGRLNMPVADVLDRGTVRCGVVFPENVIQRAIEAHSDSPAVPGAEQLAATLGSAVTQADVPQEIRDAAAIVGHLPAWFGVTLMGHQVPGTLAVAAGHTALCDSPGVGKTYSFIAAAAVLRSERTLVICPPVVLTNWGREIEMTGLATIEEIATFRAGRKEPTLDGKKVVVVADSLLVTRPAVVDRIRAWAPTIAGYDEAHRAKTIGGKRSEAVLDLVTSVPGLRRVAITGTPMLAGPQDLIPILEFTGHLSCVFGGPSAFLNRYCRQDRYGKWHARKQHLPELLDLLRKHVWVRRTKERVLPNLPAVRRRAILLDVDLKPYRAAHAEIIETITKWVEEFHSTYKRLPSHVAVRPGRDGPIDEIVEYAQESLRFVSLLQQAAGLLKVPTAVERILEHVAATSEAGPNGYPVYPEPLVVWIHHRTVLDGITTALTEEKVPHGVIVGATSDKDKNLAVDRYQAGQLPVLVCGITAAGVGVTLTRGANSCFAELAWTPALIGQAIDRQHRIGQQNAITADFLIALGTIDEHMQRVLERKGEILTAAMGDSTSELNVMSETDSLVGPTDIVVELTIEAIQAFARANGLDYRRPSVSPG